MVWIDFFKANKFIETSPVESVGLLGIAAAANARLLLQHTEERQHFRIHSIKYFAGDPFKTALCVCESLFCSSNFNKGVLKL